MSYNTRSKTNAAGSYKRRSALKVFSPQQNNKTNYQPLPKTANKTGKAGACFERHETAPTGKFFDLGEGYYGYLGFFRGELGLHVRVYQPDLDFETGLRPTKEGCVIWGRSSIFYFLDLAPLIMDEFKKSKEVLLRHPIEDSNLFILIGKEYGEIRISIRRMTKNKSSESETSYTASSVGASLSVHMWQHLIAFIPEIRDTVNELEQYAFEETKETTNDDNNVVDDNVVKWAVNSAVVDEIRSFLPPEFAECTDKSVLVSEVSKCFENLKLNDLVCAVYKRSRHLLRSYTVESIENLVRNCYSGRVMTLSLENNTTVYHSHVVYTSNQIKALREADSVNYTQPITCLHFHCNSGPESTSNWAILRFALKRCNYACSGYLCLYGRSLLPDQLKRGLRSSPYSKSKPVIMGIKISGMTSGDTKGLQIQHNTFFMPDLHCEVQSPDVQIHRLMKMPATDDEIEPLYVDLWLIFLPSKTPLIRCPEQPFIFGPRPCRPVITMQTLYDERGQTGDTELILNSTDDTESTVSLKAHKNVLMTSSDVFQKMLNPESNFLENLNSSIPFPPCSLNSANMFIRFIYSGHFGQKYRLGADEAFADIFDLMCLGHYYSMLDLKEACEKGLMYYIKKNSVPTKETEEQIFHALNSITSSDMEISSVIYMSLLLYGLLKATDIHAAIDYCKNENLAKDLKILQYDSVPMCQEGPATCDFCRLISNKLNALRFTDLFI